MTFKWLKFLWAVICFFLIWHQPAYAAILSISVSTESSGGIAGNLNTVGDAYCPTSTTPGCDVSSTDNRIRTHDIIRYQANVSVGPAGDDITLTIVMKTGLVIDQIPGACDPFLSSLSGDGSIGSPATLVCDLGAQASASFFVPIDARVRGTIMNGTQLGVDSAVINGPNSTAVTAANIADMTVTATPRIDLVKRLHSNTTGTRNGELGVNISYQAWVGLLDNTGTDPLLGNELVTSDITWVEDLSDISPNAYVYQCTTLSTSVVFPYPTINPVDVDASVTNAGNLTCDNTGETATGSVNVTISGADLSFEHIPDFVQNGSTVTSRAPDLRVAAYGVIRVFVPLTDITAAGSTLDTLNRYHSLNVTSISNQQNFNGDNEDESNNTHALTLTNRDPSFSHTQRCYHTNLPAPPWCFGAWTLPATNASSVTAGDGLIEPEQTFVTYTFYRNRSFFTDNFAEVCSVFDDRFYEPVKYNATDSSRCHGTCGTLGTDHVIEYGTGYVDSSFRDAAIVPEAAIPNECGADASNWHTSFDAAAAVGNITKIRMRRITPGNAGATFAMSTNLQAYEAASIPSAPNGTLYKSWGTYRSESGLNDYRECEYESGTASTTHRRDGCGARLILSRSTARIEKTTLPGDLANFIPAGRDVTFRLAPSFTSLGGSITDNVFIVDTIPAGAEYVLGSAVQNGVAFEPAITGTVSTGQTLTWNLGPISVNNPIDPIDFRMQTSAFTPVGTEFTNTARIDAVSDISSAAMRSDSRTVTVSSLSGLVISNVATINDVPPDTAIEFTVNYFNGTSNNFSQIDVIDVFPYNGDTRVPASDFSGTVALRSLSAQSSNAQFFATKTASSSLDAEPEAASNNLASGSTPWCPLTALHALDPAATPTIGGSSANCPQTALEVTAIRIIDSQSLAPQGVREFTIGLDLSGNAPNDRYSNDVRGITNTISLSALSPVGVATVAGVGELAAEKVMTIWDPNSEGLYAIPGNQAFYVISIQNIGTGSIDSGSIFLVDSLPSEVEFWNGDIDEGGADNFVTFSSIGFEQTVGTGIIFNPATDLAFSTAAARPTSFDQCSFEALDGLFRPDILHVCLNPKGALPNGTPDPEIKFSFRARIK